MRHRLVRAIVGVALIAPAVGASQDSGNVAAATSSHAQGCATDANRPLAAVNAEHVWRLRAYEDIACALGILDDALKTPGDVITLPREKAELARARMWAARDAAARIGR
jgi:hypothetical protein